MVPVPHVEGALAIFAVPGFAVGQVPTEACVLAFCALGLLRRQNFPWAAAVIFAVGAVTVAAPQEQAPETGAEPSVCPLPAHAEVTTPLAPTLEQYLVASAQSF